MIERVRSQLQASETRFLRRIEGVVLFNKVRSSEIRKSFNIEPLLFRIERSQLRWFGHVSRMPQERLPKQALLAKSNGRRPVEQRWSPQGHPWPRGRPRGHILKSLALASKTQVLENCPVLGSRTTLFLHS